MHSSSNTAPAAAADPFPVFHMSVLAAAVLSSAISMSALFPYVGFMVVDLGVAKNADEAGYYSGCVASAMMAGRLLSSYPWGQLADRYGRKPALLSGCASVAVMSVIFGLSTNIYMAVVSRFLLGLFNPIWGIAKTLVSELCSAKHEATGMGITSGCFSLGMVIGPMVGGLLANPAAQFPGIFGEIQLLVRFPYLLPNIVTALMAAAGGVMVFIYLPETIDRDSLRDTTAEETSVVSLVKTPGMATTMAQCLTRRVIDIPLFISAGVFATMLTYFLVSFFSITFSEVVPLWAIATRKRNGLEMPQIDIGYLMSITGVLLVIYTLFVYPKIANYLGPVLSFKVGLYVSVLFVILSTLLIYIRGAKIRYAALSVLFAGGKASSALSFSANALVLNNCVEKEKRASLNGLNMAVGSFSKTVGPTLGTWLFAWSINNGMGFPLDFRFVFIIISVVGVITALIPLPSSRAANPSMVELATGVARGRDHNGMSNGNVEYSPLDQEDEEGIAEQEGSEKEKI